MRTRALIELVNQVFSDEKTKAEFITDPNGVVSRFSLTEEERRAVLTTHARLGLVTAGSYQLDTMIDPMILWH